MRPLPIVLLAVSAFSFLAAASCSVSGEPECDCPESGEVMILLPAPCPGTASVPVVASGVCSVASTTTPVTVIAASDGVCTVTFGGADGDQVTQDITIQGQWLACGSAPHGCGERLVAIGLSTGSGGEYVVPQTAACLDAGVSDGG